MDLIKIPQLQFFCAVIDEGSVTGAARKMKCVASNITARIKELELLLGRSLFLREKGRLLPTPEGRHFYTEARALLDNTYRLSRFFDETSLRGALTIGALDVAVQNFLPRRVPAFLASHPEVDLKVLKRPTFALEAMLGRGEIDIALSDGPIVHPLLEGSLAYEERLVLVAPPGTPTIEAIDWSSTTLFLFDTDCFYRRHMENWLTRRGLPRPPIHTVESYDLIRACVSAGLGVSCFPYSMMTADEAFPVQSIEAGIDPCPVYMLWRRHGVSETARRFIDHMTATTDDPDAAVTRSRFVVSRLEFS